MTEIKFPFSELTGTLDPLGSADSPSGTIEITENGLYDVEKYFKADVNVEGGEFKIANITWVDLPETFEDSDPRPGLLLIKTADGFEDYNDIIALSEILLAWEDEWICSPKTIVTTKHPENVGDIAVWLQPYPDTYDFSVVSGDAFIWNRGVILYGDCTLTISAE